MKKLLWIYIFLQTSGIFAVPATIAILRHGEKQINQDEPFKTGKNGKKEQNYTKYLSVKGHERAAALAEMFTRDERFTKYGKPVGIFASYEEGKAVRTIDTIKPTAEKFKLKVQHKWSANDWDKFVHEIMNNKKYDGKYVIICFEHNHIKYLTGKDGFNAPQAPTTWGENDFDRVFVLHMNHEGKVVDFENIHQRLLFGDFEN